MPLHCANCSSDQVMGAMSDSITPTGLQYFQETTIIPTQGSINMSELSLTAAEKDFLENFQFAVNGILGMIICALGLVGNFLAMIILTRRNMTSSTNCYLLSLAIWDSVVLISTLFLTCFSSVPGFELYKNAAFPFVVPIMYPIALIAQTSTIWLTVSFTVERYIAVCHPMRASSMCTIRRARIVIIVVSTVSFLYNITRWFEYETKETIKNDNGVNESSYQYVATQQFGENPVYERIYFTWLYLPMMCIIPLATLAILNTFLILAVKRSTQKRREQMNVRQSRENNVTLMLSSVVIVFIICQVPALVYNMAFGINKKYVNQCFSYKILSEVRNFSVTLNSAMNIILYCAFGQKFRKTFVQTFCKCFLTQEQLTTYGSVYSNGHYGGERGSRRTFKQSIEMNANHKRSVISFNGNYEKRRLEHQILLNNHNRLDSTNSKGSVEESDTSHRYE